MAEIRRANPYLQEIIEVLDKHRQKYKSDDEARAYLSRDDNEWIDNEVFHCMVETRYFISNYYAYRDEKEGFKGLYPFFDSQEILHDEYRRLEREKGRVRALVLKARQMGSTTYNSAEFFHKTIFAEHINSIIVGQDEDQSSFIMGMYESALDFIPWWMRPRIKQRQTGSLINFDEKDENLRMTRPGLKTWVNADNGRKPTGVGRGKCQAPWTYVWTDIGPITLETIFQTMCDGQVRHVPSDGVGEWSEPKRDLYTWAFDGKQMVKRRITKVYRQMYRGEMQKIGVANGVTIEKTPEHGVLSMREWKRTLHKNSYVDRIEHLPWHGEEDVSAEFAELLAWQIAEGCDTEYSLCITQKDPVMRNRIASAVSMVIGREPINRATGKRSGYVTFSDKKYRKKLETIGYEWGHRSATKMIPSCVFSWKKERVALFLRTMFEAEGSVSDRVEFVTASRQVSESMRMLCAVFGVSLRMRPCTKYASNTKSKTRRTYYRGYIGGVSLKRFAERIGFLSERKNTLLSIAITRSVNPNAEVYPYITEMFRDACRESGAPYKKVMGCSRYVKRQNFSWRSAHAALERMESIAERLPEQFIPNSEVRVTHRFYRHCDQTKLREWAVKIREALQCPIMEERVVSSTRWKYDGFIYDLEVEGVHNYPTCGIVTHNTFGRALLSELAFWNDLSQLSKSLFPTFNTPDGFYIMESTANGRNDAWHNLWRRAEAGKVDWEPIFIPFYRREKTYSIPIKPTENFQLTKDELEIRDRIFEKDNFVIKDETFKWMRAKKEEFIATDGDDMMFSQEYTSEAEESFQSSAITAFPRGIINRFSKRTANPRWYGEITYDFDRGRPVPALEAVPADMDMPYPETDKRLHVWERPIKGCTYCVGVDVSLGNEGGDYSCCQVVKIDQGHGADRQVACWHGLINPEDLAEIVLALCWWYEEALAAVEVNSMGMVTNNSLIRTYEYENVYRFKRLDRLKHAVTDIVGWWTDYKSKRGLITKMDRLLRNDTVDIPCKFTIDECRDFTEDGAEGEGAHDDFWMALMIAVYCAHEGEDSTREAKPKGDAVDANKFYIYSRDGVLMGETTSQNEAERLSKRIIGSTIVRFAGAKANLKVGDKTIPVPADYQNTPHSPIHDDSGTASKLHYEEGVPAELITPEMVQEYEAAQEAIEESPDAWMY